MAPKRRKQYNSGILSNLYVPPLRAIQLDRELQKLPPDSLYNLTQLWMTISTTKPTPNKIQRKQGITQESLLDECKEKLKSLKGSKSKTLMKKKLINLIVTEFYTRGLNTLQLAQIDAQLLVDKPGSNSWLSSSVKMMNSTVELPENEDDINDTNRNKIVNSLTNYSYTLDSQVFLENFVVNLSNLYLTHVYISRHPYYDLILIRVQMYDYSVKRPIDFRTRGLVSDITNTSLDKMNRHQFEQEFQTILKNKALPDKLDKFSRPGLQRQVQMQTKPQVRSHKPFYVLLPMDSPHVIHSPYNTEDVAAKLVMQTLETTLMSMHSRKTATIERSTKLENKMISAIRQVDNLKMFRDADIVKPMRNLNTIFTLKGLSRFGASMGAWTPYANGDVDMNVLGDEYKHIIVQPEDFIDLTSDTDEESDSGGDEDDETKERKVAARLKFKGTTKRADLKKMFKQKAVDNREQSVDGVDINNENFITNETNRLKDKFASIVPIQECLFKVESRVPVMRREKVNFKMELLGSDVFGGLHELAERGVVDPFTVPDWLTGENAHGGEVKRGKLV